MFALNDILHGNLGVLWHHFQAPLIGAMAALAGVLAGRWRRWSWLLATAGPLGAGIGWLLLSKHPATAAGAAAARWLPIAVAAILLAPLAARLSARQGSAICLALLAAFDGWWLLGAPRTLAAAAQSGILLALVILALGLGGRLLARGGLANLALAGLGLAGALWVGRAPPVLLLLALAPGLATLALFAAPAAGEALLVPLAIDLLAAAMAAMLDGGRLHRLGVNAVDVAAAAPFLTALLAPRLRVRPPLGAVLAAGIAIFLAWAARMWLPA